MSFVVNKSHELALSTKKKTIAIDATIGNGHDALFLSNHFDKVYGFDIQDLAIKRSQKRLKDVHNVCIIHDSFVNIDTIKENKVDLVLYNLGFLPGSNRKIITQASDTIVSLNKAINMLDEDGLILVNCYLRHPRGKLEYDAVVNFLSSFKNIIFLLHSCDESVDVLIEIKLK